MVPLHRLLALPVTAALVSVAEVHAQQHDSTHVRAAARQLALPGVLVDRPELDGPIWARGAGYKARFHATGWDFIPRPGGEVPAEPITFQLAEYRVGGAPQPCNTAMPTHAGHWIHYEHGPLRESLEARADGVEQTFVVDSLPTRGALQLTLSTNSALRGEDVGDGVRFTDAHHAVHYGEAVAIDATGARCVAPTTFRAGRIDIDVPAAFVASARLPIVVDPLVASTLIGSAMAGNSYGSAPDIVWDAQLQHHVVVFEMQYATGDSDVLAYRLNANLNLVSTVIIDITSTAWERPRIAYLAYGSQCLVVAQVASSAGATTRTIRGRAFTIGALGNPFAIEVPGVPGHLPGDKRNPDICGDSNPNGPTFYTVVWENVTATDNDIHMKQVAQSNALVSAVPTPIAGSTAFERLPSISKSYGPAPVSLQYAVVAWERRLPGDTQSDIHTTVIGPTGAVLVPDSPFDATADDDGRPSVSSPALGNGNPAPGQGSRPVLVAYERRTSGASDIAGRIVDFLQGVGSPSTNLSVLDTPLSSLGDNQERPQVDCDGYWFTVTFYEFDPTGTGSFDVRASTFRTDPANDILLEGTTAVANSTNTEWFPHIAARYSSTGIPSRQHGLVWIVNNTNSQLWSGVYESSARTGGFIPFASGCGTLGITANGSTRVGDTFTITNGAVSGLPGFVFGEPAAFPLPQCPNCWLGVNGILVGGPSLTVQVPRLASLIGLVVSTQAFQYDTSGPCLGSITLSSTIDAWIYW